MLIGKEGKVEVAAEEAGVANDDSDRILPNSSDRLDYYSGKYVEGRDDLSEGVARRLVVKPSFYAGMMVACGDADIMVGGRRRQLQR